MSTCGLKSVDYDRTVRFVTLLKIEFLQWVAHDFQYGPRITLSAN